MNGIGSVSFLRYETAGHEMAGRSMAVNMRPTFICDVDSLGQNEFSLLW